MLPQCPVRKSWRARTSGLESSSIGDPLAGQKIFRITDAAVGEKTRKKPVKKTAERGFEAELWS